MKIIEKLVVSSTAPNNPNVGWVKQKADRSKELLIHDNNSWTPIVGSNSGGGSDIKVVPSIDDLDPNAKWGTIAKVEGVEYNPVKFSQLPYVKLEDLNPDGTIKDADRFPRVTNLDLNTGIAADWGDFDYCFLIPRNIDNTSPFSIIMLHPEYEYGAEEFWVCYYPNVRKGQDGVSQNDEGGTWFYDKTPGSTEATFRSFFIGWNVRDIIPEDLTFEQVLAAGDYIMAAPAVLGVTGSGLCSYMDADDYNVAGISAELELNVIDKYYLAVTESPFSELYIKKDTWIPLSSGVDIVDSVDKLDPNAEVGSIASVAVKGNYVETSIRDLYQPDASMLDQNAGILTQPELLSSVSSLKVFAPADITNIGFEPVESTFVLVPRDFSMTNKTIAMVMIDPSMGVMAQAILGSPDATQQLILVEFSYDTMSCIVNNDQVEAFNAILANGMDWCYFGNLEEGFVTTEEQFNTLDLFVNVGEGTRTIADVYVKKDKWEPLFVNTEENELSDRVSVVENELYTLSDNVASLNGNKANNITFANYHSYGKVLPNVYTRHTISSTNSVNIELGRVENNNIYNEYILELKCTSTPSSVRFKYPDNTAVTIVWASGIAPTFEAGMTYLISIAEGLGVYSMFPNS